MGLGAVAISAGLCFAVLTALLFLRASKARSNEYPRLDPAKFARCSGKTSGDLAGRLAWRVAVSCASRRCKFNAPIAQVLAPTTSSNSLGTKRMRNFRYDKLTSRGWGTGRGIGRRCAGMKIRRGAKEVAACARGQGVRGRLRPGTPGPPRGCISVHLHAPNESQLTPPRGQRDACL